jgi:hypothetical protein
VINIRDHTEPRGRQNDGGDEHIGNKNYKDGHRKESTVVEARREVMVTHMADIVIKNLHATHQHHPTTKKAVADEEALVDIDRTTISPHPDAGNTLAFISGFSRGGLLRHTLTREDDPRTLTLNKMIATTSAYATTYDDARGLLQVVTVPNQQKKGHNNNKRKNPPDDQQQGGSDMVAMTFPQRGQGGGRDRGHGGGDERGKQRSDKVTPTGTRPPQTYEVYMLG